MKNERTCIACRQKFDKQKTNLIKISKSKNGIVIENSNDGRSCYVCYNDECINKTIKNKLINKAFKCCVNNEVYDKLENIKGKYDK